MGFERDTGNEMQVEESDEESIFRQGCGGFLTHSKENQF